MQRVICFSDYKYGKSNTFFASFVHRPCPFRSFLFRKPLLCALFAAQKLHDGLARSIANEGGIACHADFSGGAQCLDDGIFHLHVRAEHPRHARFGERQARAFQRVVAKELVDAGIAMKLSVGIEGNDGLFLRSERRSSVGFNDVPFSAAHAVGEVL